MKGLGERQGQELSGDIGRDINPPTFGSSGTEDSGGSGLDTSTDSSSQRWVYGIAAGAAWEADVWGRIRSKKAAAKAESKALEADYEFARQSLAAAVARAYISTIEAAQQEANAQETLDIYQEYVEAHRRAQTAGLRERLRRVADQVAHRRRRGCALRRTGGAGADDPRDRGRDQPIPCRQI